MECLRKKHWISISNFTVNFCVWNLNQEKPIGHIKKPTGFNFKFQKKKREILMKKKQLAVKKHCHSKKTLNFIEKTYWPYKKHIVFQFQSSQSKLFPVKFELKKHIGHIKKPNFKFKFHSHFFLEFEFGKNHWPYENIQRISISNFTVNFFSVKFEF